ncbi:MAG: hypothetical protein IPK78_20980 [Rhodospirillales bacterium]|nr:hypothetical protein [Rhodospirillales bacterium]
MVGYFEQYNIAAASGLFDRTYYLENNPDVAHQEVDPLAHYIERGARELRNPGPHFDASFYIKQCRAHGEVPENPLIHYLMLGAHRGLRVHPRDAEKLINRTEDTGSVLDRPKAAAQDTTAHITIEDIQFSSSGVLTIAGAVSSALEIRRIDVYWNNELIELSRFKHLQLESISAEYIFVFRFALQGEIGHQEATQHHLRLVLQAPAERLDDFFVQINLVEDFSAGIVKISKIEAEQPIHLFVDRPSPTERDRPILCPGDLEIAGWCTADAGIASLTIVVGSTATTDIYTGVAREDVRAAFPERDDALRSGFEARVPRRDLPAGEHSVTVRVVDNNGAQRSVAFRVQVPDREDADDFVQSVYHSETCFRLHL